MDVSVKWEIPPDPWELSDKVVAFIAMNDYDFEAERYSEGRKGVCISHVPKPRITIKRGFLGLKRKVVKRFKQMHIGKLWFGYNWDLSVYGVDYVDMMQQLALDLSTEFQKIVDVTVRGKEPLIFNDPYDYSL